MVRSTAHRLGFRFRLGGCGLPGKPHLVFPVHRLALFVCECESYGHDCQPPTVCNPTDYFEVQRRLMRTDLATFQHVLGHRGWRTDTIFSCMVNDGTTFDRRLSAMIVG